MDSELIPRGLTKGLASEYNYIIKIPYINPVKNTGLWSCSRESSINRENSFIRRIPVSDTFGIGFE